MKRTKPKPATTDLPTALRALLQLVRKSLKDNSDPEAETVVAIGWAEVRGIYALSSALHTARESRDALKRQLAKSHKDLARNRADVVDHDLLQNRAVVALLVDVERVLSGEEASDRAMFATLERVRSLIKRARVQDRRKKTRLTV